MPARPSARPSASEPAPPSAALDAFRRALYPILRARDAAAFRRLLTESEELLGDTGEVTDWPEARVRVLMADLLREPARFGLPRWPMPGADPRTASTASEGATPPATSAPPAPGGDPETTSARSDTAVSDAAPARAGTDSHPSRQRPTQTPPSADLDTPLAHAAPTPEAAGPEPPAGTAPGADAPARAGARGADSGGSASASAPGADAPAWAPARGAAADADPPAADAPARKSARGTAGGTDPPPTDSSPQTASAAGEPSEAAEASPEAPPKPRPGRRPARRAPPEQLSLW